MPVDQNTLCAALLGQLEHRREKQWKIFAWVASVYVAMIGGVLALRFGNAADDFNLQFKLATTLAASALLVYSWFWVNLNWNLELDLLQALHEQGIDFPSNDKNEKYLGELRTAPPVGYACVLLAVYIAVFAVIWICRD